MLYKMKTSVNPYISPSFKFYFIEEWNRICGVGIKNKEVPLAIVLAEALTIMLNLMNAQSDADEKVTEIINAS